jgi:hypothetical protein
LDIEKKVTTLSMLQRTESDKGKARDKDIMDKAMNSNLPQQLKDMDPAKEMRKFMEQMTDEQIMKMPGMPGNTPSERRAALLKTMESPAFGKSFFFPFLFIIICYHL